MAELGKPWEKMAIMLRPPPPPELRTAVITHRGERAVLGATIEKPRCFTCEETMTGLNSQAVHFGAFLLTPTALPFKTKREATDLCHGASGWDNSTCHWSLRQKRVSFRHFVCRPLSGSRSLPLRPAASRCVPLLAADSSLLSPPRPLSALIYLPRVPQLREQDNDSPISTKSPSFLFLFCRVSRSRVAPACNNTQACCCLSVASSDPRTCARHRQARGFIVFFFFSYASPRLPSRIRFGRKGSVSAKFGSTKRRHLIKHCGSTAVFPPVCVSLPPNQLFVEFCWKN